jgi:hypothetical protein
MSRAHTPIWAGSEGVGRAASGGGECASAVSRSAPLVSPRHLLALRTYPPPQDRGRGAACVVARVGPPDEGPDLERHPCFFAPASCRECSLIWKETLCARRRPSFRTMGGHGCPTLGYDAASDVAVSLEITGAMGSGPEMGMRGVDGGGTEGWWMERRVKAGHPLLRQQCGWWLAAART